MFTVLINKQAIDELREELKDTHEVFVGEPVERDGEIWYNCPVVISTVEKYQQEKTDE